MRICAVTLETEDLDRLAAFYCAAFEVGAPSLVRADHVGLTLGDLYLGLDLVAARGDAPRPATTTWYRVADARAAHARLTALGAASEMEPDASCSPGEVLAVVRDPDGNRVGLLSRVSGA